MITPISPYLYFYCIFGQTAFTLDETYRNKSIINFRERLPVFIHVIAIKINEEEMSSLLQLFVHLYKKSKIFFSGADRCSLSLLKIEVLTQVKHPLSYYSQTRCYQRLWVIALIFNKTQTYFSNLQHVNFSWHLCR